MEPVVKASLLLFVLLNPLLVGVYLVDLIRETSLALFSRIILRASFISAAAFSMFAWAGDFVFTTIFQVRFSSFLIFGGILFLIIGLHMMMKGSAAIATLRGGEPSRVAGAVALPFMIGPGTVSASVIIGQRLGDISTTLVAVVSAVAASAVSVIAVKALHDFVQTRKEELLERYLDIVGRVVAMFTGTYAIEMIARGVETWLTSAGLSGS
ncbi:MAG: MarC family protein [Nitrospirota bacterium]|jgi:small neutral amino acid transporter SnatA (MarC family)